MASAANNIVEDIGVVETILNNKFVDVLTVETVGPINQKILTPPFNEENIFLDNEKVSVPDATVDVEYIKFVVNYGGAIKSTKDVYNRVGIATASVFTPLGKGSKRSGDIFTVIMKTMQNIQFVSEVIKITTVNIDKIGEVGGMRQTNVDINFQYFE